MNARTLRALVLLAPLATLLAGCATSEDSGVRRWRPASVEAIFAKQPPPDRIRIVLEDSVVVLEGARLETDSVIGFREEEDGRWERITVPAKLSTLEVRKVQPALVVLSFLPSLLLLVPLALGGGG